jgi:tRNA(fMet)-specific endonuclease VapC
MGKTLGPLDMQIAAHAIALGAVLVTNDKAFHHVSDLIGVKNWATDL